MMGLMTPDAPVMRYNAVPPCETLIHLTTSESTRFPPGDEPSVLLADEKSVAEVVTQAKVNLSVVVEPPPDHPWRRYRVTTGASL